MIKKGSVKKRVVHEMDKRFVIFITLLPGCGLGPRTRVLTRKIIPARTALANQDEQTITIWIHGTRIFPPSLFKTIFKGKPGLKHINELDPPSRLSSIANTLTSTDPSGYPFEHFYFFGWSGRLSFFSREQSAQILYDDILRIINEYEIINEKCPHIRIIGHSHGGNVALNLAKQKKSSDQFTIDELILLACPVQSRTMRLAADPLFKNIYSLYSRLDLIQVLDPQGLYLGESNGLFSHRLFPAHPNITQVKLKINGRALFHAEFIAPTFLSYLSAIIQEIKQWKHEHTPYADSWSRIQKLICLYTNGRTIDIHKYTLQNIRHLQHDALTV